MDNYTFQVFDEYKAHNKFECVHVCTVLIEKLSEHHSRFKGNPYAVILC